MVQKHFKKYKIGCFKSVLVINVIIAVIAVVIVTSSTIASITYRRPGPYFEVQVDTSTSEIWPKGSGKEPSSTRLNLSFNAKGDEALIFNPQDSMFIIDCSQSMRLNDPDQNVIKSSKEYIENMNYPDRSGIVKMDSNSSIIENLTGDYERLKNQIELTTEPGGSTNFEKSISLATDELIRNGDPDKKQIEILLTDGKATKNVTRNTMSKVVNNNISIYTIGFGEEVDTQRLEWIANRTGGKYYTLNNSKGLHQMYQDISNREYTNSTGEDMHLEIEFKEYIDIEKNSFSVNPDNISKEQINTTIKWSFNKTFVLGDKWNVEFNISTEKKGKQSVYSNKSGIYYTRPWDKQENFTALPDLKIEGKVEKVLLLPPPPPPSAGATPPPVEAFPMPTSPMATTTIVPQAALQPIAQTAGYQALFAPLLGLGVGEVLKGKMSVEQKEGISMSSGKTPGEREKEKEAKNLGYTFNER